MSHSKPLPPFTFDVLCYLNREQLERFSIACCPLKNFINRYFRSKPYRHFYRLDIYAGCYALYHNGVQWHPNRDEYSVEQFLDGQKCSIDDPRSNCKYYSFAQMRPYLSPTVRVSEAWISAYDSAYDRGDSYDFEHITEMESIANLWRDGEIYIWNADNCNRIGDEDFQLILNSPTILQCKTLCMFNAHFSFKDYKVFYTVNTIDIDYYREGIGHSYWPEFFEQQGVKPLVFLRQLPRESIDNILDQLCKVFSSAVLPNAFKIEFREVDQPLTEFQKTNKASAEKLELKLNFGKDYTLERYGF